MDMTKSTGYRAVEELLKAQATHMALKKQFEVARVTEMTLAQREVTVMSYQRVRNCRQYFFDLVRSHQCSTACIPLVPRVYIHEITQSSCGFLSMRFISHNY